MKIPLLTLRTSHSYRHKDRNFIDVDYDGKPLTFRYTDVRGSGILEGSNGKSNYIKFTIPYTRDNVKTLEKYKRCYVCICTFHYLEVFEKEFTVKIALFLMKSSVSILRYLIERVLKELLMIILGN